MQIGGLLFFFSVSPGSFSIGFAVDDAVAAVEFDDDALEDEYEGVPELFI